jgi:hypothetical protein
MTNRHAQRQEQLSNWATEQLSNWATEQLSNWATEQLSNWATEQLSNWGRSRAGARARARARARVKLRWKSRMVTLIRHHATTPHAATHTLTAIQLNTTATYLHTFILTRWLLYTITSHASMSVFGSHFISTSSTVLSKVQALKTITSQYQQHQQWQLQLHTLQLSAYPSLTRGVVYPLYMYLITTNRFEG